MATYTKVILSGSTNGLPVQITATATLGTTIHTSVSGTSSIDEIWLWASNTAAGTVTLTVEWGGASDPANHLVKAYSIVANSAPVLIAAGLPMNNAKVVTAFASSSSTLNVIGFVNRIIVS